MSPAAKLAALAPALGIALPSVGRAVEVPDATSAHAAPVMAPVEPPRGERARSFGGVFLGTSRSPDPYLREGGRLSIGSFAILSSSRPHLKLAVSASVLGGSRFQRVVTPYIPVWDMSEGVVLDRGSAYGSVASIYTDVMHVPIAAYSGYGLDIGRLHLYGGFGPSAHRFAISRFEQVSGVAGSVADDGQLSAGGLVTYTLDRRFDGTSSRWAAGAAGLLSMVWDVGAMPFVEGDWSFGVVAFAASPVARQGCGGAKVPWGTTCVTMSYSEQNARYYTQGKEDYDRGLASVGEIVVPVQGLTFSANAALAFAF